MKTHKKSPDGETKDEMNYSNQREHGNYMSQYSPVCPPELHASFAADGRFMMDGMPGTMFINPKQIYWIRKRKLRREMLDSIMVTQNNNYLHESRHRHAMKRLRAPSGRFLTKEEAAQARKKGDYSNGSSSF